MQLPAAPPGGDHVEYLQSLTVNFQNTSHQPLCGVQSMLSFPVVCLTYDQRCQQGARVCLFVCAAVVHLGWSYVTYLCELSYVMTAYKPKCCRRASVLDMQEGDPYPQYPDDADVPQGQSEVAFRVKAATDIKALGNELYKKVQRHIPCICLCCLVATLRGLWMACSI